MLVENEQKSMTEKITQKINGHFAIKFFGIYIFLLILGTVILLQPFSLREGQSISLVDAFFVTTSALTATGLSPVGLTSTFNMFGHFIIILLIQFGALSIVMMIAYFWLKIRQKINFNDHKTMINENPLKSENIWTFIKGVLIMVLVIQFVAFVSLSAYFLIADQFNLRQSLFQSLFMVVALFSNAGFDINWSGYSYSMYQTNYFIQSIAIILIFIGSMGLYPLYELKEFLVAKKRKESFKFSTLTKWVLALHIFIWLISAGMIFGLERTRFLADKSILESIYFTLFMGLTTRSAGFTLAPLDSLSTMTQILFMGLMFLGAAPNSFAGGIRLTTIILIALGLKAMLSGKDHIVIKERRIRYDNVFHAFVVMFVAILLVGVGFVSIALFESSVSITRVAFEVISAFGTTGLTLGTVEIMGTPAKIVLMVVMLVGRIGILPLLMRFKGSHQETSEKDRMTGDYPEIDMIVG